MRRDLVAMIPINRDPTPRQLNQFGFLWLGFLALFGAVAVLKLHRPTLAVVLWSLAIVVPTIGWLVPRFMRLVFLGMSYLSWPIGLVVSFLVLAGVYYLVVTPLGLLLRAFRYDPMRRRFDRKADSYWVVRSGAEVDPTRYFRQF